MGVRELSDGGPDGSRLGQGATDMVGFFGRTPVVKYATSIPTPSSVASNSSTATQWTFATSAQADALITAVARMHAAMSAYGLITA